MRMPKRIKSALLVVLILLLGLIGLSFARHPHPGPTADELQHREQQTPVDRQGANPPPD